MRSLAIGLLVLAPLLSTAQKKTLSFNQLLGGDYPSGILNDLPEIEGWADDDHYLETRNGQLMSVDAKTGKAAPYTMAADTAPSPPQIKDARNITLSPDHQFAAYTKADNNLYTTEIATGKETALTSDGSAVILNGYASWVYYEEILGRASHYKAFWWSPDSKSIAYMRFDDSQVPVFPIYVADGQHGYLEMQRYPKAGDTNPQVKIGVTPVATAKTVWADFDPANDQYFGTPFWTPAGELWVQWMNRGQDSLIVYAVNNGNGSKRQLFLETQPTWIALDDDRFTFLSAGKGAIVESDKDGWQNLYLHDATGKQVNAITKGSYWGTSIFYVDEKNKQVYFGARKEDPSRFDIYKASLDGKSATRLSAGPYSYEGVMASPTAKYFITTYSNISTAPVMVLMDNKGKIVREIANMKGPSFGEYAFPVTKLVKVKSDDGRYDLPMTVTYPLNFDSTKKYPVWISIYGGPNAGTVYDRWKQPAGFQQWWAQEGVIQVAMDNRASGYFGKKGLNEIYKQLGKHEIEDYMTLANWLKAKSWVDPARIGITGGSFGGYITCMALTYGADVFTHGIANYSVTNWQLYDSHYTERFMNTPKENPDGYRITSPINYASKYKGLIRIVHGTTDDNVHMQNSIQLIDTLQNLNKHFEMMIYPNQRHGIRQPKYAHNLMETIRFVYKNMLQKEMPAAFGK